jgi:hypothetical protein
MRRISYSSSTKLPVNKSNFHWRSAKHCSSAQWKEAGDDFAGSVSKVEID